MQRFQPHVAGRAIGGLAVALGIFFTGFYWTESTTPEASTRLFRTAGEPAGEPAKPIERGTSVRDAVARFRVGEVFQYRFETFQDATFGPIDEAPGNVPSESGRHSTRLVAALTVSVVASEELGYSLEFRFQDAILTSEVERLAHPEAVPESERSSLDAAGVVHFDPLGEIRGIESERASAPEGSIVLRRIAEMFQWVEGEGTEGAAWTTEEKDGFGTYQSSYVLAPEVSPGALRKTMIYRGSQDVPSLPGAILVSGRAEMVADSPARMEKAKGDRRMTFRVPERNLEIFATESVSLDLEGREFSASLASGSDARRKGLRSEGSSSLEAGGDVVSAKDFGSNLNALMEYIEELLSPEGLSDEAVIRAISLLTEFLVEHPGQSRALLGWMQEHEDFGENDIREVVIVNGLTAAGTRESQVALMDVATSGNWGPGNQSMALLSVLRVGQPMPEWDAELLDLFERDQPFGNMAVQALGVVAANLVEEESGELARRAELIEELRRHATDADPIRRSSALVGLANAHPSSLLPEVEAGLQDPDAHVRSAAMLAAAGQEGDAVDTMLWTSLRDDPSEIVRLEALQIVQERFGGEAIEPMIERLHQDPSPEVRRGTMEMLAAVPTGDDRVAQAIFHAAGHDPSEENRDYARRLSEESASPEMEGTELRGEGLEESGVAGPASPSTVLFGG